MTDALAESAEALAFLNAGNLGQSVKEGENAGAEKSPPKRVRLDRKSKDRAGANANQSIKVRMTFRLPVEIANGVIGASAERKKRRVGACCQQDIVTEALAEWLKRNNG